MASGRQLLDAEMARQWQDGQATLAPAEAAAAAVAVSLRRTGRLVLYGIGGSHHANRCAEAAWRLAGMDATAITLAEALLTPLPHGPRTALVTSQSGASGEVVRYLATPGEGEERFGLTLNAHSPLGTGLPGLVAAGGPEHAFAATRSLLLTLVMHAAILRAFAPGSAAIEPPLELGTVQPGPAAIAALAGVDLLILTGRRVLQGVAEAGALCFMELARRPALALEGGQLRHGPMELLGPRTGVILLRGPGDVAELGCRLASDCVASGAPVVVFDASGEPAVPGTMTVALPVATGLDGAITALPSLQVLLVELAALHVARLGEPLRTAKVTTVI